MAFGPGEGAGGAGSIERRVELALPASVEFVRTARMVATSIGTVAGLDVAALDDLRVGVDEACAWLLLDAAGPTLWLDFTVGPGEVVARGGTKSDPDADPLFVDEETPASSFPEADGGGPGQLVALSEELLRVVTDRFRLERGSSWSRFELVKRRTAHGA